MPALFPINSAHALGFEEIERALESVAKIQGNNYPPYNIERDLNQKEGAETLRVTLAVAGLSAELLEVIQEGRQLIVKGHKNEPDMADNLQGKNQQSDYLHKGIATREFQRTFILADTIDVTKAILKDGLLIIELHKPAPDNSRREIKIATD